MISRSVSTDELRTPSNYNNHYYRTPNIYGRARTFTIQRPLPRVSVFHNNWYGRRHPVENKKSTGIVWIPRDLCFVGAKSQYGCSNSSCRTSNYIPSESVSSRSTGEEKGPTKHLYFQKHDSKKEETHEPSLRASYRSMFPSQKFVRRFWIRQKSVRNPGDQDDIPWHNNRCDSKRGLMMNEIKVNKNSHSDSQSEWTDSLCSTLESTYTDDSSDDEGSQGIWDSRPSVDEYDAFISSSERCNFRQYLSYVNPFTFTRRMLNKMR